MKRFIIITITCASLFYIGSYPVVEEESADSVVMTTVYIPKNDSDHSGDNSIYNDPSLTVLVEPNGTRVASCRGCHFECKHCEE